ncbi:alpha/beta hydrolase [Massilia arenosa]|uniref:Alpha/beta hydrolase n=1 Tax=Zemynaea arenosa TaxID=2561931 RepID=A0A4Y9S0P0_9BURK|nr:alpha/beta hydrolase [Massilia arenosa]TFW14894.1 alpha/beta hydrolase [Massilia arenosa]
MTTPAPPPTEFAELDWNGKPLRLEYQRVAGPDQAPTVVFLHEGLGSVAIWRDFPARFCQANALHGLVYSRYGYGRSTPRPHDERWQPDYLHQQAWDVLPALLAQLGIARPWLFGHSDGASIALLHAARFSAQIRGIIVEAPHITVEDKAIAGLLTARNAYSGGALRKALARLHDDVDSAFYAWNESWLNPAFRSWDIRAEVAQITTPLMAIQGEGDEYGTLEQVYGIQRLVPHTRLLVLPGVGHTPHRDQPELIIEEASRFLRDHS